ncbi:MAG: hypothetical protein K8F52_08660 [Candidatus Scalindua rubra]|uniref:Uncharacterized protein n=1 Tax=Candidatus Scalindua brodae TaxID=237368 RepID=A0A0B0EJD5_9BACT|nr:MAG: hypothetical protein SCABRO_01559 [Candidatus Scalindua brodae]MBZ0108730.1 hypothetical protein [Candidatus Scalindua rubra]TWU31873.1 hypothetical protein S225a_19550 [Candidatus Brocadiaceae bacterium S225]
MINKEQIKAEIDNIKDEHLVILYRIIKALEVPVEGHVKQFSEQSEWHEFIQETYGCLSDAPIERGDQGVYEVREEIK